MSDIGKLARSINPSQLPNSFIFSTRNTEFRLHINYEKNEPFEPLISYTWSGAQVRQEQKNLCNRYIERNLLTPKEKYKLENIVEPAPNTLKVPYVKRPVDIFRFAYESLDAVVMFQVHQGKRLWMYMPNAVTCNRLKISINN